MNWRKVFVYPAFRIAGRKYYQSMHEHKYADALSPIDLKKFQSKKLRELLSFAYKHVPYYKRILNFDQISLGSVLNKEVFEGIPVLTKDLIRNLGSELHAQAVTLKSPQKNTSGGSTGHPVELLQDENYRIANIGFKLYIKDSVGQAVTSPEIRLWGSERDILQGREKTSIRLRNWLYNRKEYNSFVVDADKLDHMLQKWNAFKPTWGEAYVQSMHLLCRHVMDKNIPVHAPKAIVTTAGTLYGDVKADIEKVFRCPVINRYGSREVGDMAFSCPERGNMHVCPSNHYFEILNQDHQPVEPGEIGEVYVTLLTNFAMPLIRYKVGDVAQAVDDPDKRCDCGRTSSIIGKVIGRDVHLFTAADGSRVDGEYFTHLFYFCPWISQFQVIQKKLDLIHLNIVAQGKPDEAQIQNIESGIRIVLGDTCIIKWNYLESIEALPSGKYLYTISEI